MNQGKTLVHEVGHFLGLYHTFHNGNQADYIYCDSIEIYNGCNGTDFCDDTPKQKYCHFLGCGKCNDIQIGCKNCPKTCNSCSEDPIPDLVENFMGYNPDGCMTSFTDNQRRRMLKTLLGYNNRSLLLVDNHLKDN